MKRFKIYGQGENILVNEVLDIDGEDFEWFPEKCDEARLYMSANTELITRVSLTDLSGEEKEREVRNE